MVLATSENINGRRTGAKNWFDHATNIMINLGMIPLKCDAAVFVHKEKQANMIIHGQPGYFNPYGPVASTRSWRASAFEEGVGAA